MTDADAWPIPFFALALTGFAGSRVFRFLDVAGEHRGRLPTIDGLRGFLALSVFFCHVAVYRGVMRGGAWEAPAIGVASALGEAGVAMFFMITGFLFWARMLKEQGRPDWLRLYVGRVFRIGPLYLVAVGIMLAVVLRDTGFRVQVPPGQLATELIKWGGLGFFRACPVNGYDRPELQLAGVTWSLRYEWLFYLSLPALAIMALRGRFHVVAVCGIAVVLAVIVALTQAASPVASAWFCALLFSIGMICASLLRVGWLPAVQDRWGSVAAAVLLGCVVLYFRNATTAVPALLLGVAFALIVSGTSLFGLLTSRAALRLGDMSYGIYMLHGLMLAAVFHGVPAGFARTLTFSQHWALALVAGALAVAAAGLAHFAVERPGIVAGRKVAAVFVRAVRQPQRII